MAFDFNAWSGMAKKAKDLLGLGGSDQTQMNPQAMLEMKNQAAPIPQGPPPGPTPGMPEIVPPPVQNVPLTAQPTTSPLGTLPQELTPQQPNFAEDPQNQGLYSPDSAMPPSQAMSGPSQFDIMRQYLLSQKPTISPEMELQMKIADRNASEAMTRQDEELSRQQDLAAKFAAQEQRTDFRPLAAALDSWFGGNLYQAANATAPMSPEQKLLQQAELQKEISQQAGSMTKDQLDYIRQKLQQQSYVENRTSKAQLAKEANLVKLAGSEATGGYQAARLGTMKDRQAAQAADVFDKDQIIKKNESQRQQIDLDKHTLDTAKTLTPQIFNEIQIGLARAISGGSQTAVSTQEKVEFQSLQTQLQALKQRITNRPEDIDSPEVRTMLSDTMERLSEAYSNNTFQRAQQIRKGREKAYRNNQSAIDTMDAKAEAYRPMPRDKTAPSSVAPGGKPLSFDDWKKSQGR